MTKPDSDCLLERSTAIGMYFMEHRAKLLDIAAFLDRLDRTRDDLDGYTDFRMAAFEQALRVLSDGEPERARRVLEVFSDHSTEPIDSAAGLKGAHGANPPGGATGA
ncbi:MAG: hypothetical protein AAF432_05405 [Planctomycetota bacterium]